MPAVVCYGEQRSAKVQIADTGWAEIAVADIDQYISEEQNPENVKGVTAIEVSVPSALLRKGMCLIDTPGIGSVFEANTDATYSFVPHIDAALVVLGADPPLSGGEIDLVVAMSRHVDEMIFVINKADRVKPDDLTAATAFAFRVVTARLGRPVQVYQISAREVLDEKRAGRDWARFVAALDELVATSGRRLVREAQERGTIRVVRSTRESLAQRRNALENPLAESEARVQSLGSYIGDVERAANDLGHLFVAEQQRLSRQISARRTSFLAEASARGHELLNSGLDRQPGSGPGHRSHAMREATMIARQIVLPWLELEEKTVAAEYAYAINRFTAMTNEFLERLANAGFPELARLTINPIERDKLASVSGFQFHDLIHLAESASPLRYFADLVLGAFGWRRGIERDAARFLTRLLETNTSRVVSDVEHRLDIARGELEVEIRERLAGVLAVAEAELGEVRRIKEAGEAEVARELNSLKSFENELASIAVASRRQPAVPSVG